MTGLLCLPVAGDGAHGVAGDVLPDLGPGRLAHAELAQVDVVPGALDAHLLGPGRKEERRAIIMGPDWYIVPI